MTPRGLDATISVERSASFAMDVALSIPGGTTAALVGPNGAGKSTVAAVLAGLIPMDAGRVQLDGRVLDDPGSGVFVVPEDRRIGVMFQHQLLFPHMTILDNVAFGPRQRRMGVSEARARAAKWLDRIEVDAPATARPDELSGGQMQRVALARALATEPDLLVLDEPLSSLDVGARVQMRRILDEHLGTFAGPRLLITHEPADAFLLADMVYVVELGAITQSGVAGDIRMHPKSQYAADFTGTNLFDGHAHDGVVRIGDHPIHVADHGVHGDVLISIPATAVSIHATAPEGSQRNTWRTRIEQLERIGDRARIATGAPLSLTAEVTVAATDELGLDVGTDVWLAVKATEIRVDEGNRRHG